MRLHSLAHDDAGSRRTEASLAPSLLGIIVLSLPHALVRGIFDSAAFAQTAPFWRALGASQRMVTHRRAFHEERTSGRRSLALALMRGGTVR
jgi:hypothetical protein